MASDAAIPSRPRRDRPLRAPNLYDPDIVFRADDGREVTLGMIHAAMVQLAAPSWNALDRHAVLIRLGDALGIEITTEAP